jgi:hypothetical protein
MAEWLTITDAAHRLGWHPRKVESRARRERWPRRAANQGRAGEYLIPAALLAGPAETTPPPAGHDAANGAAADAATAAGLAGLVEMVAELRAELSSALTRAAHAEGELAAELRRAADLAAQVADLRRELTEARRPWLAKVLEAVRRR